MSYLNAVDAAAELAHITGKTWSADGVLIEAQAERLPACFRFTGELTISSMDGKPEGTPPRIIDFSGIVRALLPPSDDGLRYPLMPVELAEAFGIKYSHHNGAFVRGAALPTEFHHGGRIKNGHHVHCFAESCDVPLEELLFDVDDLAALTTPDIEPDEGQPHSTSNPADTTARKRPAWFEAVTPYMLKTLRSGQISSAKALFRELEKTAGGESPFDIGTDQHRGSLYVRDHLQSMSLKTLRNKFPELRAMLKK